MPNWEGIEDAATMLPRIWLTRAKDDEVWKPLRKIDCKALNESRGEEVLIEGGRATADPKTGKIRHNFLQRPTTNLMPATWFCREEKSSKEFVLQPLPEKDSWQVEMLYQNAVRASSSLGEGIDQILKEEIILESDPQYKVYVARVGGLLVMKKRLKQNSFFSLGGVQYTLQRGYGQYTVEGEDDENALGPCNHLFFVVHGIGESMWSREDVNTLSMSDEMDLLRATINKRKIASWREECKKCEKLKKSTPPPPNKIEFVVVEWYSKMRSPSHGLMTSLTSVTLRSIPALRSIANDVIFDVLMYLTPEFCGSILECVTTQIIELYSTFQRVHPTFFVDGGKCSIIGHSLGSVIAWDILSILGDNMQQHASKGNLSDPIDVDSNHKPNGVFSLQKRCDATASPMGKNPQYAKDNMHGTWGPSLPTKMKDAIPFTPHLTIFLGSPVGLFLTLRGAHAVFDEMRAVAEAERASLIPCDNEEEEPPPVFNVMPIICSPFSLPTGALYNIFHPSDPVAYRIEPLLLPEGISNNELPSPLFLSPDGKSIRLHVKARQVGDQIFKQFGSFYSKSIENAANAAAAADAAAALKMESLEGNRKEKTNQRPKFEGCIKEREVSFPLGGQSSRVDFQLQPGVIDNEYLSAVTAHSSYMNHDDVIDFLIFSTKVKAEKSENDDSEKNEAKK